MITKILIPDLGGVAGAEVVEILVNPGDVVGADQTVLILEGEKSTIEIPASSGGIVKNVLCKVGDKLDSGQEIIEIEIDDNEIEQQEESLGEDERKIVDILLPDLGGATNVKVIEILVEPGENINKNDSIVTLESEKASMDIPSPYDGKIIEISVSKDSELSQGSILGRIEIVDKRDLIAPITDASNAEQAVVKHDSAPNERQNTTNTDEIFVHNPNVHASPSVRRTAREFGVDLGKVQGTGRKGRVVLLDVQNYVKNILKGGVSGIGIPEVPSVDHQKFGEVIYQELGKIKKVTGEHVYKSWLNVPHVTHFDEADITELENYRKQQNVELSKTGIKLTPLVFIMKAVAECLIDFPTFNASLDKDKLVLKKYFNIGIAVDTDKGLVVPVIRSVDQKDVMVLSTELSNISNKAREKGLSIDEMSGSSFTISSLGGIGGTGFTPIVNVPDVAILGVSKAKTQPIYIDGEFKPRLILPFSLSYDHRVIDGAEAARFCKNLANKLANCNYVD
ncbi:MAG: 2-oxo acid dehydrogenase subunit E2 [Legionellales bacterium]|nr:2-oxo acid dehydrogenase subunit E2 [Legionellales bacterium]